MWLSLLLVFLIGFAVHRASLCTVRAIMQWMEERKTSLIISFFKATAWASLLAGAFVWAGLPIKGTPMLNVSLAFTVLGGLLFGMGAAINGGCSLSTLQRLADGDTRFIVTLVFFVLGAGLAATSQHIGFVPLVQSYPLLWMQLGVPAQRLLVALLAVWALREVWVLWCSRERDQRPGQWLLAPRYGLTLAALILGVCSGLLFLLEGAWTYTNFLRELGASWLVGTPGPGTWRLLLMLTLFLGMLASSLQRGTFLLRGWKAMQWWRSMVGGLFMGLGSTLIPGGNDTVILVLIPTLSLQALVGFLSMLAGIVSILILMRLHK